MKYIYYISSLVLVMALSSCSSSRYYQSNPDEYSHNYNQPQITYQQFYNDLSPYGDWVNYGEYGYVWVPYQSNFRPYYTNGYWVYTDYGWTWVSNYNWGWAPFHYGRWIDDMRYGWMWVPGYEWAPAWVTWRGGGEYYGWAPLAPGMDVDINVRSIPYYDWTFVPRNYINSRRVYDYTINPSRNYVIINNTTIINNYTIFNNQNGGRRPAYNPGPPVREVEQSTGSRIRRYNVVTASRPEPTQVSNSAIRVFRPAVNQQSTNNARPQRVTPPNEIRAAQNAPVREFPKEQTPQVLRNEPPARNNEPSVTPERNNNTPVRVFPNRNNNNQPEIRPTENRPVTPAPTERSNPPAENRQPETRQENNAPTRVFPNHPNPPATNQPAKQEIRRTSPAVNPPAPQQSQSSRPVRTFTNPQVQPQANPAKANENKINQRPASTPQEMRSMNQQSSRPATPVRENTPSREPVRTVNSQPVRTPQPQSQSNEKQDKNVRTFDRQKR